MRNIYLSVPLKNYEDALRLTGARPVSDAACADALLLTGGGDLAPACYGQALSGAEAIDAARDARELALVRDFLARGLPVLGICRGEQILNVALGGTLIQDIPSQRPEAAGENHRDNEHRYAPNHPARVLPGTLLRSLMGCDELLTNSVHHQAVDTPAPGMRVCALSPAGIVEGIEATDGRFLLGLQWHPEAVAAVEERMQRPFTALVKASGEKKRHH